MAAILVAERDYTMRLGIRSILTRSDRFCEIDEVSTTEELLIRLRGRDYEMIIVEPMLRDGGGPTLVRDLSIIAPRSNILVYTALDEITYARRAIRSGAKGYVMKTCSTDEFLTAVDRVGQGKMYVSSAVAEEFAVTLGNEENHNLHRTLSNRELQTFSMLVCGKTVTEIAATLQLSVKTVSTHKARLMTKLKVSSLGELIHFAISQNLMEECSAECTAMSAPAIRGKQMSFQFGAGMRR